jgi:hypothetical protein
MNTLRIAFAVALLSASSAYADSAPHWSAAIGTGHVSQNTSNSVSGPRLASTTSVATPAHWSAFIGTGRASEVNHFSAAKPSVVGSPTASAHWTSRIGTGQASESNARTQSSAITAVRARP